MVLEVGSTRQGETLRGSFNEAALALLGVPSQSPHSATARVAVGFVDYGFDLLHPCLKTPKGCASRFRFLWDQNQTPAAANNAELDVATISDWDGPFLDSVVRNAAASGSRRELDALYDPHANTGARSNPTGAAHGTLMVSIAAGTAFANFRSPAPHVALIGVQLALGDTDWKEQNQHGQPTWLGVALPQDTTWEGWRSYDDAAQIGNAIAYIYDRACRLGVDALVINLSIGAWAGAHDGASRAERAISELSAAADDKFRTGKGPRTIIVAGAGNAGADEGHWSGTVTVTAPQSFDWNMQVSDPTQNKLELWYDAAAPLNVILGLPDGTATRIVPGGTYELVSANIRIGIAEHTFKARGHLSRLRILLHPPAFPPALIEEAGETVCFRVGLSAADSEATVHAWVERDDGMVERSWLSPSHPTSSLCCLASARGALVIAGCDHHSTLQQEHPVALALSGLGPSPWSTGTSAQIPHAVAPAHAIWGARSKSRGFALTTGTSAAVALASGVIAHALSQDINCKIPDIEDQAAWDCRFGFGLLNLTTKAVTGVTK